MEFIKQKFDILDINKDALELIEYAGRTCYNSRSKIINGNSRKFVSNLIKNKHTAMLEFASMTVLFVTDRSVSHELVRHRLCSFAQQSQRYVKYKGHIQFILPPWFPDEYLGIWHGASPTICSQWKKMEELRDNYIFTNKTTVDAPFSKTHQEYILGCIRTEELYQELINHGWKAEHARKKLTNDVATEIIVKANFREWLHIFNLRVKGTTGRPDPTVKQLLNGLKTYLEKDYDVIFK